MGSEVAMKTKQELVVINYEEFEGAGVAEDTDATDLLIPKILLQQGLSKFVSDGKARAGEFRDSLTGELLGDKDGPPKVLIFAHDKSWEISYRKNGEQKARYVGSERVTIQNATKEWEVKDPSGTTINQIQHNFTCLYTGRANIEEEMPYILSMKTFSVRPAQKLCSHFQRLAKMKRPSFSQIIELVPTVLENDKGKFFYIDWKAGRDATMEEMQAANRWRGILRSSKSYTVHQADAEPGPSVGERVAKDEEGMQF